MTKYYKVSVTQTGRAINNKQENYSCFNEMTKEFSTIKEVKEWLKEEYGKCKKIKTYTDDKKNQSHHTGYIYSFKNSDCSHSPVESWYQQDWVSIKEIKATPIIIK